MKKALVTLPNSIAGTLIMKGFCQGFRANGCYVLEKDLRDINIDEIERFKPDIVLGYDYGFLFSCNSELNNFFLNSKHKFQLIHYFADEPNGKYAYVDKPELYNNYINLAEDTRVTTFIWDKDFQYQIPNSYYLPLAVNYKAYQTDFGQQYDISFVGRPLTEKRQKVLAALVRKFGKKLNIFCYEKHFLQSLDDMKDKHFLSEKELDIYKSAYRGFLTTEKEIADVYFNSIVNINITLQGKSSLNYRVFEVLASKGFLLTDDVEDIRKNFIVSKELETYKDVDDLIDKTDFYLKNPMIAKKIAIIGFADIVKSHSFTARARTILDTIKNR